MQLLPTLSETDGFLRTRNRSGRKKLRVVGNYQARDSGNVVQTSSIPVRVTQKSHQLRLVPVSEQLSQETASAENTAGRSPQRRPQDTANNVQAWVKVPVASSNGANDTPLQHSANTSQGPRGWPPASNNSGKVNGHPFPSNGHSLQVNGKDPASLIGHLEYANGASANGTALLRRDGADLANGHDRKGLLISDVSNSAILFAKWAAESEVTWQAIESFAHESLNGSPVNGANGHLINGHHQFNGHSNLHHVNGHTVDADLLNVTDNPKAMVTHVGITLMSAEEQLDRMGSQLEDLQRRLHKPAPGKVSATTANGTHVNGAQVNGVRVNGAHVNGVHVNGVQVNGAHVNGAHVNGAQVNGSHVNGVHLNGVNINGAHVNGMHVNGAYINGAAVNGAVMLMPAPPMDEGGATGPNTGAGMTDAERQLKEALEQLRQLKAENALLRGRSAVSSSQLYGAQQQLDEAARRMSRLEEENRILRRDGEETATVLSGLRNDLSGTKQERDDAQQQLAATTEKMMSLEAECIALRQTCQGMKEELEMANKQAEELRQWLVETESKMLTVSQESNMLRNAMQTMQSEMMGDVERLKGEVSKRAQMKQQLLMTRSEVATLRDELHKTQVRAGEAESQLSALRMESEAAKATKSSEQQRMESAESARKALEARCSESESKLVAARHELQSARQMMQSMEADMARMQDARRHADTRTVHLQRDLSAAEMRAAQLAEELNRERGRLETALSAASVSTNELQAVQTKIHDAQQRVQKAEERADAAEVLVRQLRAEVRAAEQARDAAVGRAGTLEVQLSGARSEAETLREKAAVATNSAADSERALAASSAELDSVKAALKEERAKLEEAEAALGVAEAALSMASAELAAAKEQTAALAPVAGDIENLQARLVEAQEQLTAAEAHRSDPSELMRLQLHLMASLAEHRESEQVRTAAEARVIELEAALAAERRRLDSAHADLAQSLAEVEAQFLAVQTQAATLSLQLASSELHAANMASNQHSANAVLATVQADLQAVESSLREGALNAPASARTLRDAADRLHALQASTDEANSYQMEAVAWTEAMEHQLGTDRSEQEALRVGIQAALEHIHRLKLELAGSWAAAAAAAEAPRASKSSTGSAVGKEDAGDHSIPAADTAGEQYMSHPLDGIDAEEMDLSVEADWHMVSANSWR